MAALPSGRHTEKMATFYTKVESMHHLPGSAARGAAKAARRLGGAYVKRLRMLGTSGDSCRR